MGNIYNKIGGGKSVKPIPCSFNWVTSGRLISVDLSKYSFVIMKVRNITASSMTSYAKDIYIGMPTNGDIVYSGWKSTHYDGSQQYVGNVVSTFHANDNGVYIDSFSNSDNRAVYSNLSFIKLYGIRGKYE